MFHFMRLQCKEIDSITVQPTGRFTMDYGEGATKIKRKGLTIVWDVQSLFRGFGDSPTRTEDKPLINAYLCPISNILWMLSVLSEESFARDEE
nr:unnamed protein product [Callosobruchus analis]